MHKHTCLKRVFIFSLLLLSFTQTNGFSSDIKSESFSPVVKKLESGEMFYEVESLGGYSFVLLPKWQIKSCTDIEKKSNVCVFVLITDNIIVMTLNVQKIYDQRQYKIIDDENDLTNKLARKNVKYSKVLRGSIEINHMPTKWLSLELENGRLVYRLGMYQGDMHINGMLVYNHGDETVGPKVVRELIGGFVNKTNTTSSLAD